MEDRDSQQLIELARLVIATRNAQSEYFRSRSPFSLRNAKQLEAQLDRLAATITAPAPPPPPAPSLFDHG